MSRRKRMKFMINVLYGCFWHGTKKNAEKGNEKINILFIIEKFFIFSLFILLFAQKHPHTHDFEHAHMVKVIMNESRLFYAYVSLMSFSSWVESCSSGAVKYKRKKNIE